MSEDPEQFFLITNSDGDTHVRRLTETEVIGFLSADNETGELTDRPYRRDEVFDADPDYWGGDRYLIIKGTVVTPQPVSVRYELR